MKEIAQGLFMVVSVLLAAWFAYRYAIRQMKKETYIQLHRNKLDYSIKSFRRCWGLLAFLSTIENKFSVIRFIRQDGVDIYYFKIANANKFIDQLTEIFYVEGHGLHFSQEIKRLLFEARGIIYGFLLVNRSNENEEIKIDNNQMINRLKELYDQLNSQLKKDFSFIYDDAQGD